MTEDLIGYPRLVQQALRSVVHGVLLRVAEEGLPGDHHFYISFATGHPGTELPFPLRDRFPEEMTIVLQHDFRELEVSEEAFAVTLRFGGHPARLRVPFEAVLAFVDPAVELGLSFRPSAQSPPEDEEAAVRVPDEGAEFAGKVVRFPGPSPGNEDPEP